MTVRIRVIPCLDLRDGRVITGHAPYEVRLDLAAAIAMANRG